MGIAGVILAAGESSRMGREKALLAWPPETHPSRKEREKDAAPGSAEALHPSNTAKGGAASPTTGTILSCAIQALSQVCYMLIVVAGNNEQALEPVVFGSGASLVQNPNPERGQFSSLQTGLHHVLNRGWDNAMVTLVDRPPVSAETLSKLVSVFAARNHGIWAVVPEYQGKHGHPILIGREMIEAFLRAPATSNAREVERANQERISYVTVEDPVVATNVDTPEEYAKIGF
jgi:CTP:molybdopterin cytidylyltransferase MocA